MRKNVKHCPLCNVEYRLVATICAECKVGLVEGPAFPGGGPTVSPWHRFLARIIDILVYFLLPFTSIGILLSEDIAIRSILFILPILIFGGWIFIETLLLSTWGTTPGKYILRIKVRDIHGNKPGLKNSFIRCLNVWYYGEGLSLDIVRLSTSYDMLMKERVAKWDKGRFIVEYERKKAPPHKSTLPLANGNPENAGGRANTSHTKSGVFMNKAYLFGIVFAVLFAWFVWPTPYHSFKQKSENMMTIIHVNRITGVACREDIDFYNGGHSDDCTAEATNIIGVFFMVLALVVANAIIKRKKEKTV